MVALGKEFEVNMYDSFLFYCVLKLLKMEKDVK